MLKMEQQRTGNYGKMRRWSVRAAGWDMWGLDPSWYAVVWLCACMCVCAVSSCEPNSTGVLGDRMGRGEWHQFNTLLALLFSPFFSPLPSPFWYAYVHNYLFFLVPLNPTTLSDRLSAVLRSRSAWWVESAVVNSFDNNNIKQIYQTKTYDLIYKTR